jgi:predicted metal-dependent HD superfamily phosphohydrolase
VAVDDLGARLEGLLLGLGVPAEATAPLRRELEERYGEPARRYHTLDHVDAVLDRAAAITGDPASRPRDPAALELAVWWHDAVYEPGKAGNEAASAWLLRDRLRPWVEPAVLERAVRLVHATDGHRADPASPDWPDVAVLLDADLGVLAGTPDEYDEYVALVRAEFGFLGEDDWRRGRGEVLRDLVSRPLFRTPRMRAREPQARENVARELALLELPRG